MKRTSERTIAAAIVTILRRHRDKRATIAEIVEAIPAYVNLTRGDLAQSPSRPGERRFEQIIRNVRSHSTGSEYGLRAISGGFALASKPAARVVARVADIRREARHV
jgi:hypothetical protein